MHNQKEIYMIKANNIILNSNPEYSSNNKIPDKIESTSTNDDAVNKIHDSEIAFETSIIDNNSKSLETEEEKLMLNNSNGTIMSKLEYNEKLDIDNQENPINLKMHLDYLFNLNDSNSRLLAGINLNYNYNDHRINRINQGVLHNNAIENGIKISKSKLARIDIDSKIKLFNLNSKENNESQLHVNGNCPL